MREEKLTSTLCIAISFGLLAITPNSILCGLAVVASLALFGLLSFLEHRKVNDLVDLNAKMKELSNRMDGIEIGRSLGR